MATLDNVNGELALRIRGVVADAQSRFWVTTGWRSLDEQWRLWDAYQEAKKEHPFTWRNYAALAAYPGTSMHGHNPSEAVDLGCQANDNKLRANLFRKWGLITPIPKEPWHAQLSPNRKPLTKEQVMGLVIEPVASVPHPRLPDSGWTFGRQGHVYAFGQSRHFGPAHDADRAIGVVVALVPANDGNGYCVVNSAGQCYAYGSFRHPGNYRFDLWGQGTIVGAIVNDNQANGGVSMVRDDGGPKLNTYALPA